MIGQFNRQIIKETIPRQDLRYRKIKNNINGFYPTDGTLS
jgi:hypothetical protein